MIKPPDLNDMFLAGLPLQMAVTLERDIEASPTIDPDAWWHVMRRLAASLAVPADCQVSDQCVPDGTQGTLKH